MASQRDESPKRSKKIYLVMAVRVQGWKSVERDLPLAFSSFEKAEIYCAEQAETWDSYTRFGLVTTGQTSNLAGPNTHSPNIQQSLEIVPTSVDKPSDMWRVIVYSAAGRTVVACGLQGINAVKKAIRDESKKETVDQADSGWVKHSNIHWKHRITGTSIIGILDDN